MRDLLQIMRFLESSDDRDAIREMLSGLSIPDMVSGDEDVSVGDMASLLANEAIMNAVSDVERADAEKAQSGKQPQSLGKKAKGGNGSTNKATAATAAAAAAAAATATEPTTRLKTLIPNN